MIAAVANFNMNFDAGSFKKGKEYKYRVNRDRDYVYVTTEEGEKQGLNIIEFNILFHLIEKK